MRLRRRRPAKCARTTRSCSSCTLKRPLGNFSRTVPVTSMLSSLLILLFWGCGPAEVGGRPAEFSGRCDVGRLQTFGACGHLKLHLGTFIQCAIPFRLDGGEVHEYIFSVFPLNKTVALGCVKPLPCPFFFHLPHSS